MTEGPPGPGSVGGDLNNHGLHERECDGFFVPVEPVQGRTFHNGRPGMVAIWRVKPPCQLPALPRLQRGGPAHNPQLAVQDQTGDDLGRLGDRPNHRAANNFHGFSVLELQPGTDAGRVRLIQIFNDQPFDPGMGQIFEPLLGNTAVRGCGGEGQRRFPNCWLVFEERPPLGQRKVPGVMTGDGQHIERNVIGRSCCYQPGKGFGSGAQALLEGGEV